MAFHQYKQWPELTSEEREQVLLRCYYTFNQSSRKVGTKYHYINVHVIPLESSSSYQQSNRVPRQLWTGGRIYNQQKVQLMHFIYIVWIFEEKVSNKRLHETLQCGQRAPFFERQYYMDPDDLMVRFYGILESCKWIIWYFFLLFVAFCI